MKRLLLIITFFTTVTFIANAQVVYEPVTNNPVYELLDELAALKVITINSLVKPYSRVYIANKLNQALEKVEKLNKRQLDEVRFYLKDYSFEVGLNNNLINGYVNVSHESRAINRDPGTVNREPGIVNREPGTVNREPGAINRDSGTVNREPGAINRDSGAGSRNLLIGGENPKNQSSSNPVTQHPASFNLNPVSFRLNTTPFKLCISPQLGARFMLNENGNFVEASGGGEAYGYLAKHVGYYFSVKYVHQSEALVNPLMFTMEEGKSWNYNQDGSVYNTEWRGGLSVGWNWGDFGIYKDRPIWGNANHGSNIMSGHPPSFPYIQLHLKPAKWIEFYSMTGFLKSNVVDSSRSSFTPGSEQIRYRKKYFSANFFTITPWKGLDLSFGNSIFWSDVFRAGYLIPFNLYKSLDESLRGSNGFISNINTNDDGHLFADISTRNIKHLNIYLGLWIDELQMARFFKTNQHNLLSWKIGFTLYDLPVKNLSLTVEGITTRPGTYDEYVPAHLYANDDYSFGNFLRGDAWEIYVCLNYRPIRGMKISASYNLAQRGGYIYMKDDAITYPLAQNLIFNQTTVGINATYNLTTNVRMFIDYAYNQYAGDLQYIPMIYKGTTNSLTLGVNLGF